MGKMIDKNSNNDDEYTPESPVVRRQIGKTTYLVKVHFNPDSKETLQDKIERMLVNEVNNPDPAA